MFFLGHRRTALFPALSAFQLGLLVLLFTGAFTSVFGQTAPYVIPYTVTTYVGPNAAYSGPGKACGSYFTLDTAGDGCLAANASVGTDPHDLRIGAFGDLFFLDNASSTGVVHRVSPFSQRMTIAAGNLVGYKACAAALDAYGDGCPASDGAGNSNLDPNSTSHNDYTAIFKASRGLGAAPNGDFYIAGYNNDLVHRIANTSISGTTVFGYMESVAGTSGTAGAPPSSGSTPVSGSLVSSARGVGADGSGNVYIADTGNYIVREESNGIITNITALSGSGTYTTPAATDVPASSDKIGEPEDVQVDSNGNIFIADFSNHVVEAIYKAGTLPGVSNPIVGNMYVIAGGPTSSLSNTVSSPVNGFYPVVPATSVPLAVRKISLDSRGNIYIPDYSNNVVWFVDHATGYIHILAGHYGATTPQSGCTGTDAENDGCPGVYSSFNFASSNSGVGSAPDNLGNLFVTEPEGSVAASSRIREIISGLNFPATATGASVTQSIDVHFAPNDSYSAGSVPTSDFTLGTPNCNTNADMTEDCILPVTFTPTVAGPDSATLSVVSAAGGKASFTLTGQGTVAAIAFDPGNTNSVAAINGSQGIAVDGAGNAYIADTGSNTVLFYNAASGTTTTFAGGGTTSCSGATDKYGDGCAATASALNAPRAVALDAFGNLYIADTGNNVIRKVTPSGKIQLVAGGATSVCAAVGQYTAGATDAVGDGCLATQATLSAPSGLAVDSVGNLYIADTGNNLIREMNKFGYIISFAGGGTVCSAAVDSNGDGCPAADTLFSAPAGLAYDRVGQNLIVADSGNSIVRKIYLATTFTDTAGVASNIQDNPVTLVAGNGQAGASVDANSVAALSQLSHPTGVAVGPAGTVYIADTGNDAVRMVTTNGVISTIGGILGASGTGTVPGSAIVTQFNAPAAIAVIPGGTLYIADSGNNRLLTDVRSAISYNFGRVNDGTSSPAQNFTETNVGTAAATLPSTLFVQSPSDPQMTLVAAANSNGSIAACASGAAFASGAICNLQGQFTPTDLNQHTDAYTEAATGISATAPVPTITLIGQGATLTPTTGVVTQTTPATGNASFGGPLTLTATITPSSCNTFAPACYPTGTVTFIVDGTASAPITLTGATSSSSASYSVTGLSVGQHTVSCQYSGDDYYAASVCSGSAITIAAAATNAVLTATNNNQPQFTPVTLSATITSSTVGIPTGSVSFYAGSTLLGSSNLNASGVATFLLSAGQDADGNPLASNNTLLPGTYSLTCKYSGSANYAASACPSISFTVTASPQTLTLTPRGCISSALYSPGTFTAALAASCPNAIFTNGVPTVATAQGSTTDATIFITASNTVSGTLTFSCSGLPTSSVCTFAPTSIPIAASSTYPLPTSIDVTLWTDIVPGTVPNVTTTAARKAGGVSRSMMIGWPLTFIGLFTMLGLRRRKLRALSLLAALVLMAGTAMTLTACAGPGSYTPSLTPAGTYPVTVTVTNGTVSAQTVVDFTVTAPGIVGQE